MLVSDEDKGSTEASESGSVLGFPKLSHMYTCWEKFLQGQTNNEFPGLSNLARAATGGSARPSLNFHSLLGILPCLNHRGDSGFVEFPRDDGQLHPPNVREVVPGRTL